MICRLVIACSLFLGLSVVSAPLFSAAIAPGASRLTPNLVDTIERPLRYRPDNGDFVIVNGGEFFNRSLYGGNTAFRVDGGDRPEFVLYLPGRGGNLRLGVRTPQGAKWLHDAAHITTRYRPGQLLYEVRDPLLGDARVLMLSVLAYADIEGVIVRAQLAGSDQTANGAPPEFIWAYGGVSGQRGKRDGDIGTENVPISEWFQLQPDFCRGNEITLAPDGFRLQAKAATIAGVVPAGSRLAIADAAQWNDIETLLASIAGPTSEATSPTGGSGRAIPDEPSKQNAMGTSRLHDPSRKAPSGLPLVVGRYTLAPGEPLFLSLARVSETGSPTPTEDLDTYRGVTATRGESRSQSPNMGGTPMPPRPASASGGADGEVRIAPVGLVAASDLPRRYRETERTFRDLRQRVNVETPDPFLDAAVGALNIAADAVWDEPQQAIMHGAIAWRTKLLGWRGPYALDALGWHERARRNFTYWAGRQNIGPIPAALPSADEKANLARNETGLHSNGDMSNSHYDMNLVAIDALFRHLQWTGDLAFAEKMWPVIERHLAWERRLFRREFGPERLPLYEAYAAIWASDDLQYHGGGTTHASAYNFYHNTQAVRLARLLGRDPSLYQHEADLIARGLRAHLWLPEQGGFAEFKDLLGLQRVHPSAALWTFYHTMDSAVPTPREAWQMTRQVDTQIPHLPVRGPGVPEGLHVLSTTNWMPYTWSINNVVLPEIVHTALGFWQAGRGAEAWTLTKGSLLAAMFMGITPGNVGSMSYLDVYRRESQRDFADSSGVLSRAIVEGLFGLRPDLLAGELHVEPGFPADWTHATLRHPDLSLRFRRDGDSDHYVITQHFSRPQALRLVLAAPRDRVGSFAVNGDSASWAVVEDAVGAPRIVITSPPGFRHEVLITWAGEPITKPSGTGVPPVAYVPGQQQGLEAHATTRARCPCHLERAPSLATERFTQITQGQMRWWQPTDPEERWPIRGPVRERRDKAFEQSTALGPTAHAAGHASPADGAVDVRCSSSSCEITPVPPDARFDCVDLVPYFNDRVTQIFRNEYRSPRSPFVSLALPKQGLGGWAGGVNATAEIDDTGLRQVAEQNGGRILLPNGVPFVTPGFSRGMGVPPVEVQDSRHEQEARVTAAPSPAPHLPSNILFTSQWDNYPREATVPLSGRAQRVLLLLAGSTNHMQSRFENGEIVVRYTDGSPARLPLENPVNWWPIEQDYFVDDFQFRRPEPLPLRVDLKTGAVRALTFPEFKGQGRRIPGGSATVLELPLDPARELHSLTVRALANEVVIGLMAATLVR